MADREGFYGLFAEHLDGKLPRAKIAMFITQFMGALVHYVALAKLRGENLCWEKFDVASYVRQLAAIFSRGVEALT
jgi:hypothetical protein